MIPVETISVCIEISWKLSLAAPLPATALGNFLLHVKSRELQDFKKTAFFGGADDIMCLFVAFLGKSVNISAAVFITL